MSQDASPPKNKDYNTIDPERQIYSEDAMGQRFKRRPKKEKKTFHKAIGDKVKNCKCSPKNTFLSLFPIARWLPQYNFRKDFFADVTGGLTVGIFHVPQGLAFAMLASLPPATGLYTAMVPVIVYMLMGTSKSLSQGSFAVICLMVATVVNREVVDNTVPTTIPPTTANATLQSLSTLTTQNVTSPTTASVPSGAWPPFIGRKMEVAVTLSFAVGIIQVLMGVARLGFVATYLSDSLVSGFTTGTAVLVVVTQVKLILQVPVPQASGVFGAIITVFNMLKNIPKINVGSLITGIICLIIILVLKHINEKYKQKLKFPIPAELIVVILGTGIGYGAKLNKNFDVSILGKIKQGLPPVSVPSMHLIPNVLGDAFVIAVVIFAINITICKMFAKKGEYSIDPSQELIAYGACNVSGAFFSCFAICNALARSVVQENVAKTQLCSVMVALLVTLVLLFVAPLFYDLPKAILAAVVIANLVGLLKQFSRFLPLWRTCKPDAIVWMSACAGTIILGVKLGLACGVVVSLLIVIFQLSRPYFSLLGQVQKTEIYRDVGEFEDAIEEPQGIKIFKFDSSLYFANVEHFRAALIKVTGFDPSHYASKAEVEKTKPKEDAAQEANANIVHEKVHEKSKTEESKLLERRYNKKIHTIIVDATSFTFIDSMGINALVTLVREYGRIGVDVLIAGCSFNLRRNLLNHGTFNDGVGNKLLFATVHDAVLHGKTSHPKTPRDSAESDDFMLNLPLDWSDDTIGLLGCTIPEQAWRDSRETNL